MKKVFGFTLAEVLITLTIIGVIAAITIPNLMQSWRKHERITQIKSAYSILSNALRMAIAEAGTPDNWDSTNSHNVYLFVNDHMLPYLKVKEDCGIYNVYHGRNFTGTGCFAKGERQSGNWFFLNDTDLDSAGVNYNWYTIKLENGMDMAFSHSPNGPRVYIAVDVNGRQGPTKAGIDVFGFQANLYSGKGYITTNISNDDKFLNYKEVMTKGLYQCNKTTSQAGLNCTHLLELNHWEFPDDYPVKKF